MTKEKIKEICKKYDIIEYTINNDMSINANQNVFFSGKGLEALPLNFNEVNGAFQCERNYLLSLKGAPNYVILNK